MGQNILLIDKGHGCTDWAVRYSGWYPLWNGQLTARVKGSFHLLPKSRLYKVFGIGKGIMHCQLVMSFEIFEYCSSPFCIQPQSLIEIGTGYLHEVWTVIHFYRQCRCNLCNSVVDELTRASISRGGYPTTTILLSGFNFQARLSQGS